MRHRWSQTSWEPFDALRVYGLMCERDTCGVAVRWREGAGPRGGVLEEVSTDGAYTWARGPRPPCGTDTRTLL